MERSFIAITAIAATLMFAGVWKATEPRSPEVPAVVDTDPVSVTAAAAPSAVGPGRIPASRAVGIASRSAPTRHPSERRGMSRYGRREPDRDIPAFAGTTDLEAAANPGRRPDGLSESSVVFSGCREVRAAGAAPLYRGSPGYRADMDGDGDGIACEDYRR
ncbi:MAG TPA: excalibur calcium-binding domain-containing protein [Sphingomonas sp.]|nr:excalibur calcium-binding domain-containing protein [Sphingomonas sp.]